MGFLDKLFGKKSSGGDKVSMAAVNFQGGKGLTAQQCGVCGQTFPCPVRTQNVLTMDTGGFVRDVGGYCDRCGGFRCPNHSKWIQVAPHTWGIGCLTCGDRLRGAS